MAAPIAYDQPTIKRSWQAFVSHLPTLVAIFFVNLGIAVVGALVVYLVLYLQDPAAFTAALFNGDNVSLAGPSATRGLEELARLPFTILGSFVGILYLVVPAIYYETGAVVKPGEAFALLLRRPLRYLLAGLLMGVAILIGLLFCIIPGIVLSLIVPVYVQRIFTSDEGILDAFGSSFQAVLRTESGLTFLGIELLVGLCVFLVSFGTCLVGGLVAGPMGAFFIMNSAYRQGVLR